jgi:hypothetical protein
VLAGGVDDDYVSGGRGNDTIYGGDGESALSGDDGNDTLVGGVGDDSLSGGSGNDKLYGGDGADLIQGGEGNDTISGGGGDDILYGGRGNDIFIYRFGDGNDSIMDFEFDDDELTIDGGEYSWSYSAYGRDYYFKDGAVLVVHGHGNSGSGSNGSGSYDSHYDSSGDADYASVSNGSSGGGAEMVAGSYDYIDDEFDYSDFGNQSVYDDYAAAGDGDWADLVATGVIEMPVTDAPVDDYAPLSDWYDDPGLHAVLGVSTIPITYDDHNLFG